MNTAYPETPGSKTGGASAQAATAIRPKAALIREKVLNALAEQDLTPDECAAIIGEDKHSVRSRFSELVAARKISKLDQTRINASGLPAHVHSITSV